MLENQEWRESIECGTESEVLSAIRYLDPDFEPEEPGKMTARGV